MSSHTDPEQDPERDMWSRRNKRRDVTEDVPEHIIKSLPPEPYPPSTPYTDPISGYQPCGCVNVQDEQRVCAGHTRPLQTTTGCVVVERTPITSWEGPLDEPVDHCGCDSSLPQKENKEEHKKRIQEIVRRLIENPDLKDTNTSTTPPLKDTNPKDAIGSSKMPLHLWPETATIAGTLGLLDGALKYGRANWRSAGVRVSIYVDAARRHINAMWEGEDLDPDSGLPHYCHALACLAILVDAHAAGKLTDDRQYPGGYRKYIDEMTPHVERLKKVHADKHPHHYTIADVAKKDDE